MTANRPRPAAATRSVPAANQMMFLFSDEVSPVTAGTDVTVVAIGRRSNHGRRTDPGSDLEYDEEIGSLMTGVRGEIALDDPELRGGYEKVAGIVRGYNPGVWRGWPPRNGASLERWAGVPGQPTPLFPGVVNPRPALNYPKIPVDVELTDHAFFPPTWAYRMAAGTVVVGWQRPPLAVFGRRFDDPAEFLDRLADQFSGPRHHFLLSLELTRVHPASPELEPAFLEMARRFDVEPLTKPPGPQGTPLDKAAGRVAEALARELRIAAAGGLSGVYRESLRQIGRLAWSAPYDALASGAAATLTAAVLKALGSKGSGRVSRSPFEDWAALGAAVPGRGARPGVPRGRRGAPGRAVLVEGPGAAVAAVVRVQPASGLTPRPRLAAASVSGDEPENNRLRAEAFRAPIPLVGVTRTTNQRRRGAGRPGNTK